MSLAQLTRNNEDGLLLKTNLFPKEWWNKKKEKKTYGSRYIHKITYPLSHTYLYECAF